MSICRPPPITSIFPYTTLFRSQKGYALVPLKLYIKNGFAKILIGLGKGKKKYDKREDLKQKQMKRDIDRAIKDNMRSEEHTSELQSRGHLVCRLLLEKKKQRQY